MSKAAALVKPDNTGKLSKRDKKPKRKTPKANNTAPLSKANHSAYCAYCAEPGKASGVKAPSVMSDVTATGPTANTELRPNKLYAMTGNTLATKPSTGGSPASKA